MSSIFYEQGDLGGCTKEIDPGTYYPKMWDFFISQLQIKSIFDLGCGAGHALMYFHERCGDVHGVDGCIEAIQNCPIKHLIDYHDFVDGPYEPDGYYDMVWCCEFVEHVEAEFKHNFLTTISKTNANYVFLTHAVPGQGGYHHVNCQEASYWIVQMRDYGYELCPRLTRMARSIAFFDSSVESNHFAAHGLVFIKKTIETPKRDAIITWCSGKQFCKNPGIKAYVNSLNSCGFDGDKLVFTHDMDIEDREYFITRGFKIIDCDPNEIQMVVRDRFYVWSRFLANTTYRYVALLDCKDVIFQKDPIVYLEKFWKGLFFIGEGKRHVECLWNSTDQQKLQQHTKNFQIPYDNWEVICAGTILGLSEHVQNLVEKIWSMTLVAPTSYSDQAVLNFLYNMFYHDNYATYFANPKISSLCATADLPKDSPPVFCKGVLFHNYLEEPYCLFHQWDRTEYKNELLEKYT